VDTATAAEPRIARHYGAGAKSKRPVSRDYGLIWLLTLLGGLGLLFWSAVLLALVAFL
jgi:hypothetical protein